MKRQIETPATFRVTLPDPRYAVLIPLFPLELGCICFDTQPNCTRGCLLSCHDQGSGGDIIMVLETEMAHPDPQRAFQVVKDAENQFNDCYPVRLGIQNGVFMIWMAEKDN